VTFGTLSLRAGNRTIRRMMISLSLFVALAMSPAGGIPVDQTPLQGAIPFDAGWTLQGERTRIVREGSREVVQVETGFAHRRDIRLKDGAIDFDVRVTRRRSFVYVYFRAQSEGEREEFYLRPHKENLPDAVQYAPVWQNRSAWQLHHGPGGTAAAPFAYDRWMHIRVVLQGPHAALFVDDMNTPALLVGHLSREPRPGFVSLGGFLPADVPGEGPIATFANVQVRPGVVPFDFAAALRGLPPAKASSEPATIVSEWAVSQAFVPKEGAPAVLPGSEQAGEFQRIRAEPSGLVQLHRHVEVPAGSRVAAAVARILVKAPRAGTAAFDLGFSDIATVFVNGVPVFRGDASYSFDRPRRDGLIGYDQARLFLPLRAGENTVSIVISDSFGGWGLMGRFVGSPEIAIEAR
jgi:hypothetical protein